MDDGWIVKDGQRIKTIQKGHCTIIVRRPILSPEEYARREQQLKDALATFARRTGRGILTEEELRHAH